MLDDEMTSGATSETLYFNDGQTYYWRVAAYYADGTNSGFHRIIIFTIPRHLLFQIINIVNILLV